jgi:porin
VAFTAACVAALLMPGVGARCQSAGASAQDPAYAASQDLRWKGLEVDLPGPADTIDGLAGGLRSDLAKLGIGYLGVSLQNYSNNLLDVARTTNGRQTYSGQRPTYFSQTFLLVTYDMGRIGIDGGQFVVGGSLSDYTWRQGGPNNFGLLTLSYDQSLFAKAVELKIGYLVNSFEFANPYVGGALASGVFGQSGNLLIQGGLNGGGITSPGLEVTLNMTSALYSKLGVERPISPEGTIADARQNKTSLDLTLPNTGVLVIDEAGYKVAATDESHDLWIRGAFAANSSRYRDFEKRAGELTGGANHFAYLLGDYQLIQTDPHARPGRGIYVGGSAYYAPPQFNRFSQLYQGRLYAKGVFDARPKDQISFVVSYNVFSGIQYRQALAADLLAHSDSLALTASYAFNLSPGAYLNVGLTYVNHPTSVTYAPQTGSALNALSNLSLFF